MLRERDREGDREREEESEEEREEEREDKEEREEAGVAVAEGEEGEAQVEKEERGEYMAAYGRIDAWSLFSWAIMERNDFLLKNCCAAEKF